MKIDNSPPRGTRDLLPDTVAVRDHVLATISEVYHRYGYRRIETPALEDIRRLQGGDGGENEKLIFQVLRRGLDDRIDGPTPIADLVDLGLRFDLTVPLTRFYGNNHATLPVPFRSFQFAPVWRAERPQKGRYRQFYQCDIDLIGDETVLAEAELIEATTQALDAIGLSDTTVRHHRPTPPSGSPIAASSPPWPRTPDWTSRAGQASSSAWTNSTRSAGTVSVLVARHTGRRAVPDATSLRSSTAPSSVKVCTPGVCRCRSTEHQVATLGTSGNEVAPLSSLIWPTVPRPEHELRILQACSLTSRRRSCW